MLLFCKENYPKWKPVEKQINNNAVKETLKVLQKDWEDIGYPNEIQLEYYEQVQNPIKDLLHVIIASTHSRKERLCNNIKEMLKDAKVISAELKLNRMPPKIYDQIPYLLNTVQDIVSLDLSNLKHIKIERMMLLEEFLTKEDNICKKLDIKILNINPNVLPAEQELENFKLYLQKQENKKIRLENVFTEIHYFIIKMMDNLDIVPSSSFEHLICDIPEKFVLSTNNMTKLKEFRDKLQTQMEEIKRRVKK